MEQNLMWKNGTTGKWLTDFCTSKTIFLQERSEITIKYIIKSYP